MEITNMIGKCLLIYNTGSDVQYPTLILVDRVEDISGKLFVIGNQPEVLFGKDNWQGGLETFIAWSSVAQFNIFEDFDACMSCLKTYENQKKRLGRFWFW